MIAQPQRPDGIGNADPLTLGTLEIHMKTRLLVVAGGAAACMAVCAAVLMRPHGRLPTEGPLNDLLASTQQLVLLGHGFPSDGGSVSFFFRAGSGERLTIVALHHSDDMGGNSRYQEIRIWPQRETTYEQEEVGPGSSSEAHLLQLLDKCTIAKAASEIVLTAPTQGSLRWLRQRVANRDGPWDQDL